MNSKIKCLFVLAVAVLSFVPVFAQEANYDEAKVPEYVLPDIMKCNDGTRVTSASVWNSKRRAEILRLFTNEMYGNMPAAPKTLHFKQLGEDQLVADEKVIRRTVLICLDAEEKHTFEIMIHLPANHTGKVPVFVGLNFITNYETLIPTNKNYFRWPVEQVTEAGFAVVTASRDSIEPDNATDWKGGVREWYDSMYPGKYSWGAISAWAWGISRIADYLQTDPDIDTKHMAVIGHSRLGKTALWVGANDKRFSLVVSNDSGCCGAAISRRAYGETFAIITRSFPHWFCKNFMKYTDSTFPLDQNGLAALSAPRPLYIASASEDKWADPKGEWLCAKNVQPVYDLFGKKGLKSTELIGAGEQDNEGTVAYHLRPGEHNLKPYDWTRYLAFARRHFGMDK